MVADGAHPRERPGQVAKRPEEFQPPGQVNLPIQNALNFPAAFLQPPLFDAAATNANNYGAIGATIGHEMG